MNRKVDFHTVRLHILSHPVLYLECADHLCVFQARTKELEGLQPKVEELQAQVQSMEGTKGWFERRLKEAEVSLTVNNCLLTGFKLQRGCFLMWFS